METQITNFTQTKNVGVAGSFINQMYGNNNSIPEIGEYCTFLHYTDRSVGIVRNIEGNTVTIEDCTTMADKRFKTDIGHQFWIHEPNGNMRTYIYKNNAWKRVTTKVVFTKEFRESIPSECIGLCLRKNNPELFDKIYNGSVMPSVVIEGITKVAKEYSKESIIFGVCDYYYDWSF